jgi:hypothetical protein
MTQTIDIIKTVMMDVCGCTVLGAGVKAEASAAVPHPPTEMSLGLTWPTHVHGPSEGYDFQPFDRSSTVTAQLNFKAHLTGLPIRFQMLGTLQHAYSSDDLLTNTFCLSSITARLVPELTVFDDRCGVIAIAWCKERFYQFAIRGQMALLCPNQSLFPTDPPHELLLNIVERAKPQCRKYIRRGYVMLKRIQARRDPSCPEHIILVNVSYP